MHHRPCFVAEVELFTYLLAEPVENLEEPSGVLVPGLVRDELEKWLEHVEVCRHDAVDLRTEDLDPDHPPVVELRTVYHGDRRASDGFRVDLRVRVFECHSEVGLYPVPDVLKVDCRPGVETRPELVGHPLSEHPRRRGHQLAEFHERAAKVFEGLPERSGERFYRQRTASDLP